MANIAIIVPTRNPGVLWHSVVRAIFSQMKFVGLIIIDSQSTDGTDFNEIRKKYTLLEISESNFNHGNTRNISLGHLPDGTDVAVFMTQDALLADPHALSRLVSVFADPSVACAYGRQLPHSDASPVAAHARLFNYPDVSRTVSLDDKAHLGLRACFLSNSFAAYRVADLQAVGGFPSSVILGEDMTVAARMLMAGKRVAYVADACAHHSHNYSVIQEFRRYFDTGVFHARSPWLLAEFGSASGEGLRFVRSELAYLWRHAPGWIPSALVRTAAKLIGYRLGRLESRWPLWFKRWCSMHKGYWG
jgi:rhamnosyltransferase